MNTHKVTSPFVWHPRNADEAWELKRTYGADAVFIAGGTLLRTQWEAGTVIMPQHLINLGSILGSSDIGVKENCVSIGALTLLSQCRSSELLHRTHPLLVEALRNVAAPSIRNMATLGGNIASMVGDTLPALLNYDAVLYWYDGQREQSETLELWLLSLTTTAVANLPDRKDRVLLRIELPFLEGEDLTLSQPSLNRTTKRFSAFHKVGRREVFTPSVVTTALTGMIDTEGCISDVRIAAAGGQTTASRLNMLEQALNGRTLDQNVIGLAYQLVLQQFEPRGDFFASVEYRKVTAANLIVSELWTLSNTLGEKGGGI